mmetsp:Transcript_21004/g.53834  ORF Transcript_21004/g.53834 Transcript_21004/m.53834 type:complete len:274 (+) Transcript_21004:549-1370(+)
MFLLRILRRDSVDAAPQQLLQLPHIHLLGHAAVVDGDAVDLARSLREGDLVAAGAPLPFVEFALVSEPIRIAAPRAILKGVHVEEVSGPHVVGVAIIDMRRLPAAPHGAWAQKVLHEVLHLVLVVLRQQCARRQLQRAGGQAQLAGLGGQLDGVRGQARQAEEIELLLLAPPARAARLHRGGVVLGVGSGLLCHVGRLVVPPVRGTCPVGPRQQACPQAPGDQVLQGVGIVGFVSRVMNGRHGGAHGVDRTARHIGHLAQVAGPNLLRHAVVH